MARSVSKDYLQNFRFTVTVIDGCGAAEDISEASSAGFHTCTTPEGTLATVNYREGQYQWTRQQPGIASMSTVTLTRGVARTDGTFFNWWMNCAGGTSGAGGRASNLGIGYRATIAISHFDRNFLTEDRGPQDPRKLTPALVYILFQAFPVKHKPASNLDATSGEVSLAELDLSYEYYNISAPERA